MKAKKAEWPYERFMEVFPGVDEYFYEDAWDYLATPSAYFSSLPMTTSEGGNAEEQLVVDCVVFDWDWMWLFDVNCTAEPVLKTHWDLDYHHCYMIHVPDDIKQASYFTTYLSSSKPSNHWLKVC